LSSSSVFISSLTSSFSLSFDFAAIFGIQLPMT
jgi:hypothetical protein